MIVDGSMIALVFQESRGGSWLVNIRYCCLFVLFDPGFSGIALQQLFPEKFSSQKLVSGHRCLHV